MKIIEVSNLYFTYKKDKKNSFKSIDNKKSKNRKIEKNIFEKDIFQLEDINFDLYESEIFSVLGPNGSGKSTLLKILAKILKFEYGYIKVLDDDIKNYSYKQYSKLVHYIPQNPLFSYDFSVIDAIVMGVNPNLNFLEFPSKMHYENAINLLEEFNIMQLKDKRLDQISGGELQIVFFLRALISEARIIILDEPTAFLDFKNQFKILETIMKISGIKKTIIVSLHDPNHVLKISDKVMLLKQGRILTTGKPDEILTEENLSFLYDHNVKKVKGDDSEYFFKI